jgi:hypothetical protein
MSCPSCGRKPENGVQTHHLGCEDRGPNRRALHVAFAAESAERERTPESECIKDGCTNPRAVSRGPRPTKYCDEHKTGSKK